MHISFLSTRWVVAVATLLACVFVAAPATAGDEAGLTETSFVSVGALAGSRLTDPGDWSGVLGAEVAFLPFTGTKCSQHVLLHSPTTVDDPSATTNEAPQTPAACDEARMWLPGVDLGVSYAPEPETTVMWLEAELYNRSRFRPGAVSFGAGVGPVVSLGESVEAGAQLTAWTAVFGLVPYARGGWMHESGSFGEIGMMLKAPLPIL